MVPKLCPHLPLGHLCPLPSCRIDLVFPKTYESGPAFGLCSLWLECSSPDSHMLCFLTSFRPLTRTTCLLTNASKNLTDYCHLRKLIYLNISLHHPWVFQVISLFVPIWNYSLISLPIYVHLTIMCTNEAFLDIPKRNWLLHFSIPMTDLHAFIRTYMFYKEEKSSQSSLNVKSLIDEAQLSVDKHQQFSSKPPNIFHHGHMESHKLKLPSIYLMGPQRQITLLFPNFFNFFLQNSFLSSFGFIVLHSFELYVTLSRLSFTRSFVSGWDESNCLSFPIPNLWEEKTVWIILN